MTFSVASANELAYLRTDGQWSKLLLAFPEPPIIFKARVNEASPSNDMRWKITFDGVTVGAFGDLIPGMTVWIGSAEGGYDLGIGRVRKACTSSVIYVGETSELNIANNSYITVLNEYGLWAKHRYVKLDGSTHTPYMDRDIAYSDQHEDFDPIPILGGSRVLMYDGTLGGANVITTQMDASDSYCIDGSTISAYLWDEGDASAIDDTAIAAPTITFNAPGTYVVSCKVTSTNAKYYTGYRTIVVYDDTELPISDFVMNSCSGDYQRGGWSARIKMYANADLSVVRNRAHVMLFSQDYYGDITTLTSAGISFDSATKKILKADGLEVFTTDMSIRISGSVSNDGLYSISTGGVATEIVINETLVTEGAGATITIDVINGHTELSMGQLSGQENVIMEGWIIGESINFNPNDGTVEFEIGGAQDMLNEMDGFISYLFHSETAPTEWDYVLDLTVDKAI